MQKTTDVHTKIGFNSTVAFCMQCVKHSKLAPLNRSQKICTYSEKRGAKQRKVSDPTGDLEVSLLSRKMRVQICAYYFRGFKYLPKSSLLSQVKTPGSQHSYKVSEE